jgi:hypothetical protein
LSHSVDHAAILAILPFRQTPDDAGSYRLQFSTVGLRSRRPRLGLTRECDASTPSVLLRPNLVSAKSRI